MPNKKRYLKHKKVVHRLKNTDILVVQKEHLQVLIDLVMKSLFHNSNKHGMYLKKEILKPLNIELPQKEYDKVWDVVVNSGLVSPMMGFGNSGKVELTNAGIKLMTQYGSYQEFLASQKPQKNILNNLLLSVENESENKNKTPANPPDTQKDNEQDAP